MDEGVVMEMSAWEFWNETTKERRYCENHKREDRCWCRKQKEMGMKRMIGLFVASVLMCGDAVALDYTQEGRVVQSGYAGPGISLQEVGMFGTGLGIFTTLGLFDWPTGKVPTIAAALGLGLGMGAYRKEHWDAVNGIPSAAKSKHPHMESGLVAELLE
jgi:hypothetical protein